jgi:hypothetical protein
MEQNDPDDDREYDVAKSCASKRRYRTPEAAGKAANMAHRRGSRDELRIYPCELCGGFHLTKTSLDQVAARARP